ncbi:MAG: hypothetical protein L0228_07860 [Planctomycetes bacterium]|nr:hypothetical protein [Planctomycetota bacterium]
MPQQFVHHFPAEMSEIYVRFDSEGPVSALTFRPYDKSTKEARILGLGAWFSTAAVRSGEVIRIIVLDRDKRLYRIARDNVVQTEEETAARVRLESAASDKIADEEFQTLVRLTNKRPPKLAQQELLQIADRTICKPRPQSLVAASIRHEGVPAGLRLLLQELHDGRCQLCSFTFQKPDGEPYFEIHHLDPTLGHHPRNLLVLCANCHAQFEHAKLTDLRWTRDWLVAVTINGRRRFVRQPFVKSALRRYLFRLSALAVAHWGYSFISGRLAA